ncbi:MAG: formate dehydrogenase accessory sulfurtransferase FdhD [Hyphomicrobiaceae bacterium]
MSSACARGASLPPTLPSERTAVQTTRSVRRIEWRDGLALQGTRTLAEEQPIAISYNGSTHAVLMATPADLEDLGIGFSMTEGIIDSIGAIEAIEVVAFDIGYDVQLRVRDDIAERLAKRRRTMAGPVGCGLCGLESLEAATRKLDPVTADQAFSTTDIARGVRSMETHQSLNRATSAVHAAGFFLPGHDVSLVREDVGRHNALDKLIGALFRAGSKADAGGFVITSRVSVELVQKIAAAGGGLLAAISAPTAYAVRAGEETNVTIVAVVRGNAFEVFTHAHRLTSGAAPDVA